MSLHQQKWLVSSENKLKYSWMQLKSNIPIYKQSKILTLSTQKVFNYFIV